MLASGDADQAPFIAERVGAAIWLGQAEGVIQETFWAVPRLLEILALERPLVAVIDDIHWAEPTLLDLLEYVAGFSRGHPLLMLCTARPELWEDHPGWGQSGTAVSLHALGPTESEDWGAVTELSPEDARTKVGGSLQTLVAGS